jgi:hypothetical protein
MSIQKEIEALRSDVEKEIDRIWLEEPEELLKMRMGFIDSGAGSYGQYFTTLVFADGEVRALGYICFTGIQNAIEDSNFDLKHIQSLSKILVPVCAEFLGYCGLNKIWEFSRKYLDIVSRAESKDGLKELVRSLALYVNRMHGWIHYYFPWGVGSQYRQKTKEDIEMLRKMINETRED